MSRFLRRIISHTLIAVSLWLVVAPAHAQTTTTTNNGTLDIGPKGLGAAVAAAFVIIGVGAGIGIYFAVRQPRIAGCVAAGPDGALTLQGTNASDPVYVLTGETASLHAGSHVKVVAKRKKDAKGQPMLLVSRVAKDYGACSAAPRALLQPAAALPAFTSPQPAGAP